MTLHGNVKIMDFGLAQLADQSRLTKTATIVGTPAYMSPEQAERQPTDTRTDLWSLGVVLYEMISGALPFEGETEHAILYGIVSSQPEPLTALRAGLPVELDRIIAKAMAKDPAERYQHVDELLVDLRALKREISTTDRRPAAPAHTPGNRKVWYILAAVIAAVAIAVVVMRHSPPEPRQITEPLFATPLTSLPGWEREPSLSPDGSQVAFTWNGPAEDNYDIYVKVVGTEGTLRLTTDPARDFSPAWSADGRSIVFLREGTGGKGDLMLIPPVGGAETILREVYLAPSAGPFLLQSPHVAWSPDSRWIVFTDRESADKPFSLFALSVETRELHQVTTGPSNPTQGLGDSGPAFSPDDKTLVFHRSTGIGVSSLFLQSLSEGFRAIGEPVPLTAAPGMNFSPAWTPSGEEILFAAGSPGNWALWRVQPSASAVPQRLATIGEGGARVTLSRDGKRLVYMREMNDIDLWELPLSTPGSAAGEPREFIASTRIEVAPSFSSDGRIAWTSTRSGTAEIWVVS